MSAIGRSARPGVVEPLGLAGQVDEEDLVEAALAQKLGRQKYYEMYDIKVCDLRYHHHHERKTEAAAGA